MGSPCSLEALQHFQGDFGRPVQPFGRKRLKGFAVASVAAVKFRHYRGNVVGCQQDLLLHRPRMRATTYNKAKASKHFFSLFFMAKRGVSSGRVARVHSVRDYGKETC